MNSDITEQWCNKVYEDLHREQLTLMNSMKTLNIGDEAPKGKEADLTKQLSLISSLMLNVMKLRNLRKTILQKGNM